MERARLNDCGPLLLNQYIFKTWKSRCNVLSIRKKKTSRNLLFSNFPKIHNPDAATRDIKQHVNPYVNVSWLLIHDVNTSCHDQLLAPPYNEHNEHTHKHYMLQICMCTLVPQPPGLH